MYLGILTICKYSIRSLADLGGVRGGSRGGARALFHFRILFCRKAPTSEVHAPPTGNPGSATDVALLSMCYLIYEMVISGSECCGFVLHFVFYQKMKEGIFEVWVVLAIYLYCTFLQNFIVNCCSCREQEQYI